ncbi:hypothetical protein KY290_013496 [Solanum tuberosum]|uniref:Uncharacterized protein n=1 Tax=Solanum tuberosum TaxID=4113 RepID=A0ABQ7VNY5_SOLTU|nr:hypothetical protein KY290_013496 [Solanum tuberosum]
MNVRAVFAKSKKGQNIEYLKSRVFKGNPKEVLPKISGWRGREKARREWEEAGAGTKEKSHFKRSSETFVLDNIVHEGENRLCSKMMFDALGCQYKDFQDDKLTNLSEDLNSSSKSDKYSLWISWQASINMAAVFDCCARRREANALGNLHREAERKPTETVQLQETFTTGKYKKWKIILTGRPVEDPSFLNYRPPHCRRD